MFKKLFQSKNPKKPRTAVQENQRSTAFQSLVERSIAAWNVNNYVGEDKDTTIQRHTQKLRGFRSIDDVVLCREYWFFQLRAHFMGQSRLAKWDSSHLDRYILLPIDYGFVNNRDCFFISHYWRTRSHPDPEDIDMALFRDDLRDQQWSYVWIDWTCMPQVPRSKGEDHYFRKMLRSIPLLVQDCGFEWRFPTFEARAWVLFEVTMWLLNHKPPTSLTDDMKTFFNHVQEMVRDGVLPTLEKYGYRCTNQSDLSLVTGWMEIMVILFKTVSNVRIRQEIVERIYAPFVGSVKFYDPELEIDKSAGTITIGGIVHKFTPIYQLTLDHNPDENGVRQA